MIMNYWNHFGKKVRLGLFSLNFNECYDFLFFLNNPYIAILPSLDSMPKL